VNPTVSSARCPVTGEMDTEFVVSYNPCITSDNRLVNATVENWVSNVSGLIFNAKGARGTERAFYEEEYDFSSESAESELMIFEDDRALSMYDNVVDFIQQSAPLPGEGRVLDVGCGKGLLLKRFVGRHSQWRPYGIEQSRNALRLLAENLPEAQVFEGLLQDDPFGGERFELITANGVLEHVPDPLAFLASCGNLLGAGGRLYIGVPNFATNPTDLFTFDHVTRFTPATARALFGLAGFTIRAEWVLSTRVPMWFLLEPAEPQPLPDRATIVQDSKGHVASAQRFIERSFAAYDRCVADASHAGGKIALYGLGAIGLLGTAYTTMKASKISCLADDNPHYWGTRKEGLEIVSPAELVPRGITHVAVAANPCNVIQIRQRLSRSNGQTLGIYSA
jgi:2-polyprenyl-3-methyl-5-hydroxy-6-metoxy-1,4-benzoquinol methylase